MAYFKCSGVNPTGNATEADVLSGKTFSNASGIDKTGTMTNRGAVSQTLNTSTTSYTIPAGYHNGSGTVSITTQTKSASPSTSAQTITPDSGKVLSSVSISAISPQRTAGTAAVASGIDGTGPYVYFPYGWWPNGGSSRNYTRLTAAQAVAACPSQEKTSTPTTRSATAATVTPDSGKLLSKVTVNTNSVPNSNSGTKTITSSDTNWISGNVDMGATNTYRYVNAVNVYNKGKTDGAANEPKVKFGNTTGSYVTITCDFVIKTVILATVGGDYSTSGRWDACLWNTYPSSSTGTTIFVADYIDSRYGGVTHGANLSIEMASNRKSFIISSSSKPSNVTINYIAMSVM